MPQFSFQIQPLDSAPSFAECRDEKDAWGQGVTLMGEALRDLDGSLPGSAELTLEVKDQTGRQVANISVRAHRSR